MASPVTCSGTPSLPCSKLCTSMPVPDKPAADGEGVPCCHIYQGNVGSLCEDLAQVVASKQHLSKWIQI
eukprot:CAMPEP_0115673610 /NCGR_PEP_ID=MMETSP0272-20121206/53186_1 /TAXON_ID=71861 /ORGANISM="Scrippsiella trochoidea, Strain CCMP3099" /LENGTH=68 /DNA_ID=CAMNT_0003112477 /DNA_START=82 /DNA_END=285 /DNA_ORIENTATION=+